MSGRFERAIRGPWRDAAPAIVGVINATPDSFSDGGERADPAAAVRHALACGDAADAWDVGGESTRPGAERVSIDEQRRRVVPVIEALRDAVDVPIAIDTTRIEVARAAIDAGATVINDVSAGRESRDAMLHLAAERGAAIILMHMRGEPATMQREPAYDDVVGEVADFLLERIDAAAAAGVRRGAIVIDPGIGFGKTTAHNLTLMAHLDVLTATGCAVMLGTSRKRFLGELTGADEPRDRATATAATTAWGVSQGVRIFRVHDVKANRHAADVTLAVLRHRSCR